MGPRRETCVNRDGPIELVPCLNHGSLYITRKVQVWKAQKCIPLVGAVTPLTCVGRQTTPSHKRLYRANNGNLRKLGLTYRHGTVFCPKTTSISQGSFGYGESRNVIH